MDTDIPIINTQSSIIDAVLIMTEKKYGCVVVLDKNKKIKGIITDGDLDVDFLMWIWMKKLQWLWKADQLLQLVIYWFHQP